MALLKYCGGIQNNQEIYFSYYGFVILTCSAPSINNDLPYFC